MLPSQTARSSSSRAHMYRRTRNRKLPALIVALFILAGGGFAYKFWLGSGEPSSANADLTAATTPPPAAPPANPPKTTPPPREQPKPASPTLATDKPTEKINMGAPPAPNAPKAPPSEGPAASVAHTASASDPSPALDIRPKPEPEKGSASTNSTPQPPAPQLTSLAGQRLQAGLALLAQNKPVEARSMLTSALDSPNISPADADRIRLELTKLNQRMIFGPEVMAGDPFASSYTIEAGDSLAKLPRKLNLKVDWRFLQRINNIAAPEKIRVGQKIKLIKGPFHAVINKRDFRMDVYMGDAAGRGERVFVASMMVGLGEFGATPEGVFAVRSNSKLVDPAWTNPRTGEYFASGDPKNPLGKYWIGLIGISDNIRDLETYGIHGTIDPDSIGEMRSMGCVRLGADDVALAYELFLEQASRIEIHGDDFP